MSKTSIAYLRAPPKIRLVQYDLTGHFVRHTCLQVGLINNSAKLFSGNDCTFMVAMGYADKKMFSYM
jgi:hypothetical protein